MANPQVFDELSSRMSKKRPDSGIHNSSEFSGSHDRMNKSSTSEPNDSGLGSDQVDSKTAKKSGVLKNIKKFFKKPKRKSKEGSGQTDKSESFATQIEVRSEPDILGQSTRGEVKPPPMRRFVSERAQSIDDNDQSVVFSDEEETESKEKKKNLKDAQQYIRSSLRKFKIRRRKSEGGSSTTSDGKSNGDSLKDRERDNVDPPQHASVNGFYATHQQPEITEEPASPIDEPLNLDLLEDVSPRQIQSSAAKDKIRVAPKDRRKPSRYRSPPPSTTHTSSLKEISENNDEQPSKHRNSAHPSNSSSKSSLYDHSGASTHSIEEKQFFTNIHLPKSSDVQRNAYVESSHVGRNSSPPQRSKSTNSRENVNIRKAYRTGSGEGGNTELERDVRSYNSLGELDLSHISRSNMKPSKSEHDHLAKKYGKEAELEDRVKYNDGEYFHPRRSVGMLSHDEDKFFYRGSQEDIQDENEKDSSSAGNLYRNVLRKSQENLSIDITTTSRKASVPENLYSRDRLNKKSHENISAADKSSQENLSSSGKLYNRDSLRRTHTDVAEKSFSRKNNEDNTERKLSNETNFKSESRNSYKETMFVLTSPRRDLELPPDFLKKADKREGNISESSSKVSENVSENQTSKAGQRERPHSVKISSVDVANPKKEIVMPKSNDRVSDLGRSLKPSTRPKPSPRKERKEDESLASNSNPNSTDSKLPEFSRISLKRVPKTDDFADDGSRTSSARSPETEDNRSQEFSQSSHESSSKSSDPLKSVERAREPVAPRKSVSPTETPGTLPEFKRLSLKTVPKRDDYLLKEEDTSSDKKADVTPIKIKERKNEADFIPPQRSFTVSGRNSPKPPPKPRVETKPFSFQSRDVISSDNRSMSVSSGDARRRATSPSNQDENKAPEWIKIAKSKQQEKDEESELQSTVKPSVTKPKPNPPPTASKSLKLGSPPMAVPSRAAHHSMMGEVKNTKDLCIVCGKVAYMFERCDVNKHILHKHCAKCDTCSRKLNVGGIFITDNKPYCSQHKM